MDAQKAWLIGLMAGDGSFEYYLHKHNPGYRLIVSCGLDKELASITAKALEETYPHSKGIVSENKPSPDDPKRQMTYNAEMSGKAATEDMLDYYPMCRELAISRMIESEKEFLATGNIIRYPLHTKDTKTHTWRIPAPILQASDEILGAWIAGFVDADGHVRCDLTKSQREVSMCSVNQIGLEEVSQALTRLGVRNAVGFSPPPKAHPTWSDKWIIYITNQVAVRQFHKWAPLKAPEKKRRLELAVATYQFKIIPPEVKDKIIEMLLELDKTHQNIADELSLTRRQVRQVAYDRQDELIARTNGNYRSLAAGKRGKKKIC